MKIAEMLESYKFSKHISYPFIPVICFEASSRAYVNNPYLKKYGAKSGQNFISISDSGYEAWGDWSKRFMIRTPELAREVIDDTESFLKSNQESITKLVGRDYPPMSPGEIGNVLKELDKFLIDLYHLYIFFIDECFDVNDEALNRSLPELRMELSACAAKLYEGCDKVIAALAKLNTDISWRVFTHATVNEIIDFVDAPEKDIHKLEDIVDRPIAFICLNNELITLFGQEVLDLKNYLNEKDDQLASKDKSDDVHVIKGQVVYQGKVVGRVVKILETDYVNAASIVGELKDYILVTKMTRPEIVSLIKNAAAIVTDEGGITCHAAIVSRELKKPCVVGTRVATQVLQDGDLIEVDAERGVVTFIERK